MNKLSDGLSEQSVLFVSVAKWFRLSSAAGVIVGTGATVFLKALSFATTYAGQFNYYYFSLPVALFASAALVKYLAPDAKGHGTEKVIEAVHRASGKIDAKVVPVKLAATIATLAAGGSAGKEGPCAQIGAGLASVFADLLRLREGDRKKLVICGISAGFAAVFGTPIAGAIFGVEVLYCGSILYDVLFPSFIAGIIGYQVSSALGIHYTYHPVNFVPAFSESFFLKISLAGVFFGLCSVLLIESLTRMERLSERWQVWQPLKGLVGGGVLVIVAMVVSPQFLGLGLETIESALRGEHIVWYAFLLKIFFTTVTLSFGGSGGIITPIFFVGATAGSLFATFLGLDPATCAAIGMASLVAGAANTPIAASIMAVEMFGPQIAPYAAVACVISFLITGHRSVYPAQVLSVRKSASVVASVGTEFRHVEVEVQPVEGGLIHTVQKVSGIIGEQIHKRHNRNSDS